MKSDEARWATKTEIAELNAAEVVRRKICLRLVEILAELFGPGTFHHGRFLMNLDEVGPILGVPPAVLRRRLAKGELRGVRLGERGQWKMRVGDVLKLLVESWMGPHEPYRVGEVGMLDHASKRPTNIKGSLQRSGTPGRPRRQLG